VGWDDWVRGEEVEPSLYGADFARLGEQIDALLGAGCRIFHFDVGDGHFVEPITMGPIVLQSIAPRIHAGGGRIDVHLMVESPAKYFEAVARAGGDSATFHFEAVDDVPATIAAARDAGLGVGVAFNPETDPERVAPLAASADLVLCMSIHPGYSGQTFREETYDRLEQLRLLVPASRLLQVDGGVGPANIERLHDCGASLLVAASSIFGDADPATSYTRLVDAIA
jgi:ribulose-phosphate 3-epimerase